MTPPSGQPVISKKSANAVEYIAQDKFDQNILLWRQEWRPTHPSKN
jgi:hypothetical protein